MIIGMANNGKPNKKGDLKPASPESLRRILELQAKLKQDLLALLEHPAVPQNFKDKFAGKI